MITTSDFKRGLRILVENEPYVITHFEHFKPGKGNQFTRTKLKHLITGTNLERTIRSGEKFQEPDVFFADMSYLYKDEKGFHFMNPQSYEQIELSESIIKEDKNFLLEGLEVKVCFYNEKPVGIELPPSINLKVTHTEPGFKGNTATNTTKPATLETGLTVQVPLHINIDDTVKVNTETGKYVERVNL